MASEFEISCDQGGTALEEQKSGARTIGMVMVITLLGKVMGLYRDHLLAVHYGMGMEASAFYTASRIPRVFFDAVFASAISACFIPVFSEYLESGGKKKAFAFSRSFLTVIGLVTLVLTALGTLCSGGLVTLFADGYNAETAALASSLTRIMFPTVFFTGLAFSFVGILQSLDEFRIPALISAVSNAVIILYFWTMDEKFGVYGLAIAFLIGWALQAFVQLPALRKKGFSYRPVWDVRSEGMKKVFALMGPVMVSTWVQPINLTVNSKFGSHLYEGAGVSAIEYATNLYLVIAGVFILSITNVIFPKLSRLAAGDQGDAFMTTIRTTLHASLFFVLPMSAGLMVVARPLIAFVYGGGEFDDFSVQITSSALGWVSLGMAGYAVQNILSRAYFARQSGKVPLIAGAVSIGVNIVLCMALTESLAVSGLAIASAVSSTVYALLLLLPMQKGEQKVLDGKFGLDLLKMLLATILMAAAAAGVVHLTGGLIAGKLGLLVTLGLGAAAGVAVYFIMTVLLRLEEAALTASIVKQVLKRG